MEQDSVSFQLAFQDGDALGKGADLRLGGVGAVLVAVHCPASGACLIV
jgi:hypothetical protein